MEVPGASVSGVYPPGPGVLRGERARLHCRGPAGGAGEQREGLGLHHVRVQQLLLVLHRPLCPGPGALPGAGGHPGRGAGPGRAAG